MQLLRRALLLNLLLTLSLAVVMAGTVSAQRKGASAPKKGAGSKPAARNATSERKPTTRKPVQTKVTGKASAKVQSKDRSSKGKGKAGTTAKPDRKDSAAAKLAAKERLRLEAERRRAAEEDRRRREQAAREAAERRRQFELGLQRQAVENILKDNLEGEDLEVRRAVTGALKGHAGTVVVMDPRSGRILSIVNQEWAVRQGFKPCSTIKLVTGVAGLNERAIGPGGSIIDRSFPMNLDDALAHSNNPYFQLVGREVGNQRLINYAKALGLGQPTGINLPGESGGKLPWNNNNPRIYSHGDDFEVTPLQLAVMVSAITNGGRVVVPKVVKRYELAGFRSTPRRDVGLPMNSVQGVIPGMVGAAMYGTARRNLDQSLGVAGKTGSCIGQGSWVGLFASVAPVDDPKLAVVVITRGENQRGRQAAAIAASIYSSLRGRIGVRRAGVQPLLAANPNLKPQNKVSAKEAVKLDEDADEESSDTRGTASRRANPNVRATGQSSPSKPGAFPPVVIRTEAPKTGGATRPRVVQGN